MITAADCAAARSLKLKPASSSAQQSRWAWVVLFLLTLMAYFGALAGPFQFDDYNVINCSSVDYSWQAWLHNLAHGLRPLLKASYLLNCSIDPAPVGFHLLNVLLHLANTVLVYQLVTAWGRHSAPQTDKSFNRWQPIAFGTACLFALHPLHTEAVTYISGRSTALMSFFVFACILAYQRDCQRAAGKAGPWTLLLALCAVLSKETAFLLLPALILWEWACGSCVRVIAAKLWPLMLLWLTLGVFLLANTADRQLVQNAWMQPEFGQSLPTLLHADGVLLWRLIWPIGFNIDPDWPVLSFAANGLRVFLYWSVLVLLLLLMVYQRSRRPWLAFALGWLVLHLVLLNGLLPRRDVINERQMYLADWPLLIGVVRCLYGCLRARLAIIVLCAVSLLLAGLTVQRNSRYGSEILLWEDTVAHSATKARAWNNLGWAYESAGRNVDAMAAYQHAVKLSPEDMKARNNLSRLARRP